MSESNMSILEAWCNGRPVIVAGGYIPESAKKALGVGGKYGGRKLAVACGGHVVSNPDLIFRVKNGPKLAPYHGATFYTVGSKDGYVDYPLSMALSAQGSVEAGL
jgi:NADPH2 dehydrogenase